MGAVDEGGAMSEETGEAWCPHSEIEVAEPMRARCKRCGWPFELAESGPLGRGGFVPSYVPPEERARYRPRDERDQP